MVQFFDRGSFTDAPLLPLYSNEERQGRFGGEIQKKKRGGGCPTRHLRTINHGYLSTQLAATHTNNRYGYVLLVGWVQGGKGRGGGYLTWLTGARWEEERVRPPTVVKKNGNLTHTSLPHLKKTMEIIPEVLILQ